MGVWHKGKVTSRPKGLKYLKGFKGKIDFDKNHSWFDGGLDSMKALLDNHPLFGIDLGVVSHVSMVTLNASIDVDPKTEKSTFKSQWIEKLFGGKAAYVNNGTDEYLETIQEQQ